MGNATESVTVGDASQARSLLAFLLPVSFGEVGRCRAFLEASLLKIPFAVLPINQRMRSDP